MLPWLRELANTTLLYRDNPPVTAKQLSVLIASSAVLLTLCRSPFFGFLNVSSVILAILSNAVFMAFGAIFLVFGGQDPLQEGLKFSRLFFVTWDSEFGPLLSQLFSTACDL